MTVLRRVSERVYRIEDRFVNLYVIDAGKIALVDTGTRKATALVRSGLRELGKEPEDIGTILLTHHHLDHVGTAGVWKREAGATVAIHETDAPVLAHRERRRPSGVGLRGKAMVLFGGIFSRIQAVPALEADRTIRDRDALDVLGLRLEAIHVPGHTLGSCAFHLLSDDVLFAGDAVNGRRGEPAPPVFVEDRRAAEASFAMLTAMQVTVLAPGHGSPILRPPAPSPKVP